ncbi:hypothetical protein, partial [Desulfobulbus alkaliphilus]|uniref:hypothetical protein n=1 Tax=Desulfobulbus alkaliphilus TaxID=869814 RepID=UPI0019642D7B
TFIETSLWYILGELVLDPTVAKTLYSHGGFFSLPDLCIQTLPLFSEFCRMFLVFTLKIGEVSLITEEVP